MLGGLRMGPHTIYQHRAQFFYNNDELYAHSLIRAIFTGEHLLPL